MKYTLFIVNANHDQGEGHVERCKRIIVDFDKYFSIPLLVEFKNKNFCFKSYDPIEEKFQSINKPLANSEVAIIIDSYKEISLNSFHEDYLIIWTSVLSDRGINNPNKTENQISVDLLGEKRLNAQNVLVPKKFFITNNHKNGCVIMFGGSTPFSTYQKVIMTVLANQSINKRIGVVYTGEDKSILELINNSKLEICNNKDYIANFLSTFEFGIGSGGFGWFERIANSVGQIVIPSSENELIRAKLIVNNLKGFKLITLNNINELSQISFFKHQNLCGLDGKGPKRIAYKINLFWSLKGIKQYSDVEWHEKSKYFIDVFTDSSDISKKILIRNLEELEIINYFDLQIQILKCYKNSQILKKSIPLYLKKDCQQNIEIIIDKRSWFIYKIYSLINDLIKENVNIYINSNHKNESEIKDKFLFGYQEIIDENYLNGKNKWMIIHESNLPNGKGWSPMTWSILEGKKEIIGTLFEASNKVDEGKILKKSKLILKNIRVVDDLRNLQIELCKNLIMKWLYKIPNDFITNDFENKYYKKRTPKDSFLNLNNDQLNLLKVSDNINYPLWTEIDGHKVFLFTKKIDNK